MQTSRASLHTILSVVAGIALALILIACTHIHAMNIIYTHWKVEMFSPSKILFKEFTSKIRAYPDAIKYTLSSNNSKISIYLLAPGKSILELPSYLRQLNNYLHNTSIVLVPIGVNSTELIKSAVALCIVSKYRNVLENETLLNKVLEQVNENSTSILRRYSKCSYILNLSNASKVVETCKSLIRLVFLSGLLNKTISMRLFDYVSGEHESPLPIYVVCNYATGVCVAATLNELSIVYRNIQVEVPFGYS